MTPEAPVKDVKKAKASAVVTASPPGIQPTSAANTRTRRWLAPPLRENVASQREQRYRGQQGLPGQLVRPPAARPSPGCTRTRTEVPLTRQSMRRSAGLGSPPTGAQGHPTAARGGRRALPKDREPPALRRRPARWPAPETSPNSSKPCAGRSRRTRETSRTRTARPAGRKPRCRRPRAQRSQRSRTRRPDMRKPRRRPRTCRFAQAP